MSEKKSASPTRRAACSVHTAFVRERFPLRGLASLERVEDAGGFETTAQEKSVIIRNQSLLRSCRTAGPCALCGKQCKKRESHHIFARGLGGGNTLDIKINLLAVGSTRHRECHCHSLVDTKEGRIRCIRIVAEREKCLPQQIEEAINFIRYLDKSASRYAIQEGLIGLSEAAKRIAARELDEAGKLT